MLSKATSVKNVMNMVILLFSVTPFLFVFFLNMQLSDSGKSIEYLLSTSPIVSIQLISVCLVAFMAYILKVRKKTIELNKDSIVPYISFSFILIALLFLGNVTYVGLMIVVLYMYHSKRALNLKKIDIKNGINHLLSVKLIGEYIILICSILIRLLIVRVN